MEKIDNELHRFYGARLSQERASLEPTVDVEVLFQQLESIPRPEGSQFAAKYVKMWRDILTKTPIQKRFSVLSNLQVDLLEQFYADEMLGKLEKLVSRASPLQKLDLERIPRPDVRTFFEEAHHCYLYGFSIACAVMCRAILEAALAERLEPEKERRRPKPSNQLDAWSRVRSNILRLLDQAEARGILDRSRVDAGERVKDAGDAAIHRLRDFKKQWDSDDQLRLLVEDTRKVVEDLHRAIPAT